MPAGIYIHYPFCKKKCLYCDFVSTTHLEARNGYLSHLIKEYFLYSSDWRGDAFDTLYIGGGTPSLLPDKDWEQLTSWKNQTLSKIQEFTVEANPESITELFLRNLKNSGCERISIGIQSMDNNCLSFSGRIHTSEDAIRSIERVHAVHIPTISVDFILGLPGESDKTIEKNIQFIQWAQPQHISLYFLSFPDNSGILNLLRKNPSLFPEEANILTRWHRYTDVFAEMGYEHYEISNFSLPGYASRHNSHYWNFDAYLGLGVNASSYDQSNRWTNYKTLKTYCEKLEQSIKPVRFLESLTKKTKQFERIMLGLRNLKTGMPFSWIKRNKESAIQELLSLEWIFIEDSVVYVTEKGCIWLDSIIRKLT